MVTVNIISLPNQGFSIQTNNESIYNFLRLAKWWSVPITGNINLRENIVGADTYTFNFSDTIIADGFLVAGSFAYVVQYLGDHYFNAAISGGISGFSGKSGYSGYSGNSGASYSGFSGYSGGGHSGYSGYSGLDGTATASGYSGYSGKSGYSGYSGSGISGYSGFSGSGISGYSGVGQSGYSGYSGSSTTEYAATFATMSASTATRFVYVQADETNNGDHSLYLYINSILKFIQTVA